MTRGLSVLFIASIWALVVLCIGSTLFASRLQVYLLPTVVLFGASYVLLAVASVAGRLHSEPAPKAARSKSRTR